MHRPATLLLPALAVGAVALTACSAAPVAGSPTTGPPAAVVTTAPPGTAAPAPTTPPTAADGTDLAPCKDGSCDVLVTGPTTIPAPRRTGFLSLKVVRAGSGLGLAWTTPGGGGSATGSASGHIAEGTDFEFTDLGDGTAILRVHPG
jgi:hypothetical protein